MLTVIPGRRSGTKAYITSITSAFAIIARAVRGAVSLADGSRPSKATSDVQPRARPLHGLVRNKNVPFILTEATLCALLTQAKLFLRSLTSESLPALPRFQPVDETRS